MKEETKEPGEFLAVLVALLMSICISFYMAWIFTKLVIWYSIPLTLNTIQWFGISMIVGVITNRPDWDKAKRSGYTLMENQFKLFVLISFYWLINFLIYKFIIS